MNLELDSATAAKLAAIVNHLNGLDGGSRTPADVVVWMLDSFRHLRPDVGAAVDKAGV